MAMIDHFPVYYRYFSQQIYTYGAKTLNNHNKLLGKIPGVDGIKTGYTAAAGFTLAAPAMRDGKSLIAVALGGPSTMAGDGNVAALREGGVGVLDRSGLGERTTVGADRNAPEEVGQREVMGTN